MLNSYAIFKFIFFSPFTQVQFSISQFDIDLQLKNLNFVVVIVEAVCLIKIKTKKWSINQNLKFFIYCNIEK